MVRDGPHHVLDWEHANRETRWPGIRSRDHHAGVKQPFQITGGLDRLLDAYRAHSGWRSLPISSVLDRWMASPP